MLRYIFRTAICVFLIGGALVAPLSVSYAQKKDSKKVYVAHIGTDDIFQSAIVAKLLYAIGYEPELRHLESNVSYIFASIHENTVLANVWSHAERDFYQSAGGAKVFSVLRKDFYTVTEGIFVSRELAEKYRIKTIKDLNQPEVIKALDHDKDGKVDIIGCDKSWGCKKYIDNLIDANKSQSYVKQISNNHYVSIMHAIDNYLNFGTPFVAYMWTPSWTAQLLTKKTVSQISFVDVPNSVAVKDVTHRGVNTGFHVDPISIVVNKNWAKKNPDAERLLSVIRLDSDKLLPYIFRIHQERLSEREIFTLVDKWINNNFKLVRMWINYANRGGKNK